MTEREARLITEALEFFKRWDAGIIDGDMYVPFLDACAALLAERAARIPKPGEVDIIRDSPNDITLRPEFDQRTGKRRMG